MYIYYLTNTKEGSLLPNWEDHWIPYIKDQKQVRNNNGNVNGMYPMYLNWLWIELDTIT